VVEVISFDSGTGKRWNEQGPSQDNMTASKRFNKSARPFRGEILDQAVVRVGDGRGFIVGLDDTGMLERFVITAAHCLPHLPPACSF
jgi:hypothetical protein